MNIKKLLVTLVAGAALVSQTAFAAERISTVSLRSPLAEEVKLEGKDVVVYLHDRNDEVVGAVRITVQGNRK